VTTEIRFCLRCHEHFWCLVFFAPINGFHAVVIACVSSLAFVSTELGELIIAAAVDCPFDSVTRRSYDSQCLHDPFECFILA